MQFLCEEMPAEKVGIFTTLKEKIFILAWGVKFDRVSVLKEAPLLNFPSCVLLKEIPPLALL